MTEDSLNVDQAEIGKFEKLASRWWDPNSEFKPLHDINPLRLEYIDRMSGGLTGKDVLDVGCGGGILSESMAAKGARVTGIDMGDAPLQVARLHLLESNRDVDYRKVPVETLAGEQPASFDIVTCMELLEHVPDPASVVSACSTLVRPGGRVFFSTLNRNLKSYLFAIIGAEYLLRLLPQGTHDYRSFIRPSELDRWSRASGLQCEDIVGLSYNPINRTFTLGKDIGVNYMVCCSR